MKKSKTCCNDILKEEETVLTRESWNPLKEQHVPHTIHSKLAPCADLMLFF